MQKGIRLDIKTVAFLLDQCARSRALDIGKSVHCHLKLTGFKHPTTLLANHLIHMYCKCGDHVEARKVFDTMGGKNIYSWNNMLSGYVKLGMIKPARRVFDKMPDRDIVSWNTMVIAYAHNGVCDEAVRFYQEFRRMDIGLNEYSFAGIVMVCVKLRELMLTKQVHCQILISGFLSNEILVSSVVDAYAKCGDLIDARWLFDKMARKDVRAYTTLVCGYAKWGDIRSARALFDEIPEKNPVSWTAMIGGYAQNNMGRDALELFVKMMMLHIRPDQFTFNSCLCACASIASLSHGKQIHAYLIRNSFRPNSVVVSSLIDMYAKCGCLKAGKEVFEIMGDKQDVVLWSTLISSFANHGNGEAASNLYGQMLKLGVIPDRVTFLVLLTACSHSGLVNEGVRFFESMITEHNVVPDQEHYACLIDILGRAGCSGDIIDQIKKLSCEPDRHGNVQLGLDCQLSASCVLLSRIYAALGNQESVEKIRKLMNDDNFRKKQAPGKLKVDHNLHQVSVADTCLASREANSVHELLGDQSSGS